VQSYHAPLMSGRLPEQIDPIRLADEGARISGELPLRAFSRLREVDHSESGDSPVSIVLVFERTLQGLRLMRGRLHARLRLICQRCLEPMEVVLEAKPTSVLLRPGETSSALMDNADTLTIEGPRRLSELVEDELLLVLPMVPMHDEGVCQMPVANHDPAGEAVGKSGPFSALRDRSAKD